MKRKLWFVILVIVIVVILAGLGLGYTYVHSKLDQIQTVDLVEEEVEVNELPEEVEEAEADYTTIAIFGLDNRGLSTEALSKGLSDVIMIVSINNDTKEMQMVSVYRDTYLNTSPNSGDKFQKANAAYAYGGPERAISMLNTNLDLKIDNYITVNFQTVADAIDVLGGVEINIDSADELKWLNFYIEHTNSIMHTNAPSVSGTGPQVLSGVQAVAYGRIRYTAGGDYSRAERHRTVLTQLFKQAKDADLATLNELLDVICPEIKTNLSHQHMLELMTTVLSYDLTNSRGFPFEKSTTMHGSAGSIVVPCDLETNVRELHEYLYGNTDYVPSETVLNYSTTIKSETGMGVSSAVADQYENIDDFSDQQPSEVLNLEDMDEEDLEITEEMMDDGYVE